MTDEEINEAIALQLGWAKCACGDIRCGVWFPHGTSHPNEAELGVPSFCKDLNAMAEAEKFALGGSTAWLEFAVNLMRVLEAEQMSELDGMTCILQATARQRAEALLRTVGQWKEAKP